MIPSRNTHSRVILLEKVSGKVALLLFTKYGQQEFNTEHDWLSCFLLIYFYHFIWPWMHQNIVTFLLTFMYNISCMYISLLCVDSLCTPPPHLHTVFRQVKSILVVISVLSCHVVCVWVRSAVWLRSSFIKRPPHGDPAVAFHFSSYFHTHGATHDSASSASMSFSHAASVATHWNRWTPLLYQHLCKLTSGSYAQVH